MLSDYDFNILPKPLLAWFKENARALPWRENPTPYRVWVSEIMLQQTRVEAVKPYFERFVERLPDIPALAACPEDTLLKLWEGLGYYNRVRNMQKAAVQMVERYGGALPADYEKLLGLQGIGSYTAGAIASIAYGICAPAVDGNVLRVLTRVAADDTDIKKPSFCRQAEERLTALLRDVPDPGALNQALMELGATVCVPNGAPLCGRCPWEAVCLAKKRGQTDAFPVKSRAKARRIEQKTVLVIRDADKVAIRRRPETGLLAGLYELPNLEGVCTPEEALAAVKDMNLTPIRIQRLEAAKHIFSHVEWRMEGYAVLVQEADFDGEKRDADVLFADVAGVREKYAIPSAFAAYAKYMDVKIGKESFLREKED